MQLSEKYKPWCFWGRLSQIPGQDNLKQVFNFHGGWGLGHFSSWNCAVPCKACSPLGLLPLNGSATPNCCKIPALTLPPLPNPLTPPLVSCSAVNNYCPREFHPCWGPSPRADGMCTSSFTPDLCSELHISITCCLLAVQFMGHRSHLRTQIMAAMSARSQVREPGVILGALLPLSLHGYPIHQKFF